MEISLIVTTYNKPEHLRVVLESIRRQSSLPCQVVVADDGSDERTAALIREFQEDFPIPVIHAWQPDQGFRAARSRNNGIRHAGGDYILFIDGDIILHRHFMRDFRRAARPGELIFVKRVSLTPEFSAQILKSGTAPRNIPFWSRGIEPPRDRAIRFPLLARMKKTSLNSGKLGSSTLGAFRRDIEKVNGFDNTFTGWGYEDNDFAARMIHAGYPLKVIKFIAPVYHLWHPEAARSSLSENASKYTTTLENKSVRTKDGLQQTE